MRWGSSANLLLKQVQETTARESPRLHACFSREGKLVLQMMSVLSFEVLVQERDVLEELAAPLEAAPRVRRTWVLLVRLFQGVRVQKPARRRQQPASGYITAAHHARWG